MFGHFSVSSGKCDFVWQLYEHHCCLRSERGRMFDYFGILFPTSFPSALPRQILPDVFRFGDTFRVPFWSTVSDFRPPFSDYFSRSGFRSQSAELTWRRCGARCSHSGRPGLQDSGRESVTLAAVLRSSAEPPPCQGVLLRAVQHFCEESVPLCVNSFFTVQLK